MASDRVQKALNELDGYNKIVNRLEPEIHIIDPGAFYASAAISLKRIADALEEANVNMKRLTHRGL